MKQFPFWIKRLLTAFGLVLLYMAWTHSVNPGNLIVIAVAAFLVALFFTDKQPMTAITPKKIVYAFLYVGYLSVAILRSNLDVAGRVIQKKIPLNPGIVKVHTKLKSKTGRMILANSITLTPGTLSVDVRDDFFYIHWIDISAGNLEEASTTIVAGFEKYLEVLFD